MPYNFKTQTKIKSLVWFRRDLRDYDNAALYHALRISYQVYCVFVFDTEILDQLNDKADRRVEFIWESVRELKISLQNKGGDLIVLHGKARDIIPKLALSLQVNAVFANRDYEPSAIARDSSVANELEYQSIAFHSYKDHVIFEKDEILNLAGKPYGVFTPYKNMWLKTVNDFYIRLYPVDAYLTNLASPPKVEMPDLESMGFVRTNLTKIPLPTGMHGALSLFNDFKQRMKLYKDARDFPAVKGVSYLSVHLRFGTISIRYLVHEAIHANDIGAQTWLNELIWRDFYVQILHHNPHVAAGHSYKSEFDNLPYLNSNILFKAWCDGNTGYPLVDAAMRQLNTTGFMHNRLRMVSACFLVKDLLIDWRWGERYFADKLIDFDLSANNGGWQWASSTGCDAQPWFRIFNPVTQSQRFDPQGKFIRRYVPELAKCNEKEIHSPWLISPLRLQELDLTIGKDYPSPVVNHSTQRALTLEMFKNTKSFQISDSL